MQVDDFVIALEVVDSPSSAHLSICTNNNTLPYPIDQHLVLVIWVEIVAVATTETRDDHIRAKV